MESAIRKCANTVWLWATIAIVIWNLVAARFIPEANNDPHDSVSALPKHPTTSLRNRFR